mmetsp:Transcript_20001/g.20123  ORF Transcript_20001/g.20123 Transcript_20001/m.20123 type:complete len:80 (-) Transcript_20001:129-368(-)
MITIETRQSIEGRDEHACQPPEGSDWRAGQHTRDSRSRTLSSQRQTAAPPREPKSASRSEQKEKEELFDGRVPVVGRLQ